jgi:hypothetical protein
LVFVFLISSLLSGRVQERLPAHFSFILWDACVIITIANGIRLAFSHLIPRRDQTNQHKE